MHDKSILVMLFIANGGTINAEFNSHNLQNNSNASCNALVTLRQRPRRMQYVLEVPINVAETCLNLKINLAFQFILRPS